MKCKKIMKCHRIKKSAKTIKRPLPPKFFIYKDVIYQQGEINKEGKVIGLDELGVAIVKVKLKKVVEIPRKEPLMRIYEFVINRKDFIKDGFTGDKDTANFELTLYRRVTKELILKKYKE